MLVQLNVIPVSVVLAPLCALSWFPCVSPLPRRSLGSAECRVANRYRFPAGLLVQLNVIPVSVVLAPLCLGSAECRPYLADLLVQLNVLPDSAFNSRLATSFTSPSTSSGSPPFTCSHHRPPVLTTVHLFSSPFPGFLLPLHRNVTSLRPRSSPRSLQPCHPLHSFTTPFTGYFQPPTRAHVSVHRHLASVRTRHERLHPGMHPQGPRGEPVQQRVSTSICI